MDDTTNLRPPEDASTPAQPSSLTDRLVGVITAPAEIFAELKGRPAAVANWLVPWLLVSIAATILSIIALSQPAIIRTMQEQREKAGEQLQKQVTAGKMTQAQLDRINDLTERLLGPTMMKILSGPEALISSACGLFGWGVVFWLALKFLAKTEVPYMKVIEVCGLALVIDVLQKLIRSFLVLWKENMLATVSPTLFLSNPSVTSRSDMFLSMFDAVDIWWLAVLTIGLSKVAGVSARTAGLITFGIWFGFRLGSLLLIRKQA